MLKLVTEKELSNLNFKRLKKALICVKSDLIDSDNNMQLAVDSLIDINNITIDSNNFTLGKVNVKPYGYDDMYIDKDLVEEKVYQIKSSSIVN